MYVLGLALVYSALGLFAGMTGTLFGSVSTNPWLYFAMANLLLIAALAMLDVLPVRVPTRVARAREQCRNSGACVRRVHDGGDVGARRRALFGTGDGRGADVGVDDEIAALGFVYLFVFSLGMCTLLVVVGLSSGAIARLPRAGMWMVWVKRVFAVVMIGVAEYYLVKMGQLIL